MSVPTQPASTPVAVARRRLFLRLARDIAAELRGAVATRPARERVDELDKLLATIDREAADT